MDSEKLQEHHEIYAKLNAERFASKIYYNYKLEFDIAGHQVISSNFDRTANLDQFSGSLLIRSEIILGNKLTEMKPIYSDRYV